MTGLRTGRFRVATLGAALAACAWAATSACGGDGAPGRADVVVDTVDGVPRVTSAGEGAWGEGDAWRVGEPVLAVGSVEGDPRTTFGNATGMVLAGDGRLYVADEQAGEIRVFDRDGGGHLLTFGRSGDGPGEFRYLDALALTPEGVLAARDSRASRISFFERDGTFLRSFRLERPFFQLGGGDGLWTDAEGRIFDRTGLALGGGGADSLGVIVYRADGRVADTVLAAVWERSRILLEQDGLLRASTPIPYEPSGHVAVGPDGTIWTALGGAYNVRALDPAGRHLRTVRRALPAPPLEGAERDSARARVERRVETLRELGGGGTVSEWSLPETRPFLSGLVVDELGHLWVARDGFGGEAPTRYDVFDPEGRLLGEVSVPIARFRVRQIGGDFILGERTDELGVDQVVLLPLERDCAG